MTASPVLTQSGSRQAAYVGRWLILLVSVLTSGLLLAWWPGTRTAVVAMLVLTFGLSWAAGFDILHPLCWFSLLFCLYSVSVPMMVLLGETGRVVDPVRGTRFEWLGLVFYALAVGPAARPWSRERARSRMRERLSNVATPATLLYVFSFVPCSLYLIGVVRGHLDTKYEIALSSDPLLRLSIAFLVSSSAFAAVLAIRLAHNLPVRRFVLFNLAFVTFAFLITGERDLVVRGALIPLLLTHALRRPIPYRLVLVGVVVFVLGLPLLQSSKNILVSGSLATDQRSFATQVFGDEFSSASLNLNVLLADPSSRGILGYSSVEADLSQVVTAGALQIGSTDRLPSKWFNRRYFPAVVARGGGQGFSLVGEGYVTAGAPGVALWFVVLGLMMRFLYRAGRRTAAGLLIYCLSLPVAAYVIRADFGNFAAQMSKAILLPMILVLVTRRLTGVRRNIRL